MDDAERKSAWFLWENQEGLLDKDTLPERYIPHDVIKGFDVTGVANALGILAADAALFSEKGAEAGPEMLRDLGARLRELDD